MEHKTQPISKRMVYDAWKQVKAKKGAGGVDGKSIQDYEADLSNNLYKLWNRMCSGSYFPKGVKQVAIPKKGGKTRKLGIPTIEDRIAQQVVKNQLEPALDPIFDKDSYGYRPNRGAHDALDAARTRCRKLRWVIDMDIQGFFDHLDHELLMQLVAKHTTEKWVLMYIERWLKAPIHTEEGQIYPSKGTPQGGVISPLLANLFLHHAFDLWFRQVCPTLEFERYADDIIVHCKTERQAIAVLNLIKEQLHTWGLTLHPEKTKIVYCQNHKGPKWYKNVKFDFLGFSFHLRKSCNKQGDRFMGFDLGISRESITRIGKELRGMTFLSLTGIKVEDLAAGVNPKLGGWFNYFGKFRPSLLRDLAYRINLKLVRWACKRFKMKGVKQGWKYLRHVHVKQPRLFAHWRWFGLPSMI